MKNPRSRSTSLSPSPATRSFVGIGETGLDYHYTAETKAIQQTSLRLHIEAAQETGLPLIIHSRDADADMEAILAEGMAPESPTPA